MGNMAVVRQLELGGETLSFACPKSNRTAGCTRGQFEGLTRDPWHHSLHSHGSTMRTG